MAFEHPMLQDMAGRNDWRLFLQQGISILPEQKLVYVEASKCACTQTKTILADILAAPGRFDRSLSPHNKANTGLASVRELGEAAVVEALTSPDWYRFTVVRDPFDRLVSAYNDKIANAVAIEGNANYKTVVRRIKSRLTGIHPEDIKLDAEPALTFDEFVWFVSQQPVREMDRHWYPVANTIWHDLIRYNRIVSMEDFHNGMKTVLAETGLPDVMGDMDERQNTVAKPHPTESYYHKGTLELVKALYKADFDTFGYDPERLDTLVTAPPPVRFGQLQDAVARRSTHLEAAKSRMKDVTFIATAIEREDCAMALVRSVNEIFPEASVRVAWQGEPSEALVQFMANAGNAALDTLPYDTGLSAARNHLVSQISTPFFCLCDDDFVFTEADGLAHALALLEAEPDLGVVGGSLTNFNYRPDGSLASRTALRYAGKVLYDLDLGIVAHFEASLLNLPRELIGDTHFVRCDTVLNFGVFRTSVFQGDNPARWDDRMKITGEHLDFYLDNMEQRRFAVAYLPKLHAEHHRHTSLAYRELRLRLQGVRVLYTKWGLKTTMKVPGHVRVRAGNRYFNTTISNPLSTASRGENLPQMDFRFLVLPFASAEGGGFLPRLPEKVVRNVFRKLDRAFEKDGKSIGPMDYVRALVNAAFEVPNLQYRGTHVRLDAAQDRRIIKTLEQLHAGLLLVDRQDLFAAALERLASRHPGQSLETLPVDAVAAQIEQLANSRLRCFEALKSSDLAITEHVYRSDQNGDAALAKTVADYLGLDVGEPLDTHPIQLPNEQLAKAWRAMAPLLEQSLSHQRLGGLPFGEIGPDLSAVR